MKKNGSSKWQNLDRVEAKLMELFREMVEHDGLSRLLVDVKPLKKGRKNVVLSSGKDFHFVLKPIQEPAEKSNLGN